MNRAIKHTAGRAAVAVLPVVTVLILGQLATYPNLTPWYASLAKPSFNPPNWIFGPVWSTLYVLMIIAAWRVLRLPDVTSGRRLALTLFFNQLALNGLWSWMFFGLQSPALGLFNIIPQLILICATAVGFWKLDRFAAACMMPLAAWVAFAMLLNIEIWRLNG